KPVHHYHPQQAYHRQSRYSLRRDDGRTRGKQTGGNENDPATKGGSERRERAARRRDAATFFDGGRITPGQFARGALIPGSARAGVLAKAPPRFCRLLPERSFRRDAETRHARRARYPEQRTPNTSNLGNA